MAKHVPRFYLDKSEKIDADQLVQISSEQMYHAAKVLRLQNGDNVIVFNAKIGEWNCVILDVKKNLVKCVNKIRDAIKSSNADITIAFAIINPNKMAILLEKITELGVTKIIPIISRHTQYNKVNQDRINQIVISACEQCERLSIPQIFEPKKLESFLQNYNDFNLDCNLFIADEKLRNNRFDLLNEKRKKYTFLIGPEGGFSEEERHMFESYDFIKRISLGKNILRSETAAIALTSIAYLQNT